MVQTVRPELAEMHKWHDPKQPQPCRTKILKTLRWLLSSMRQCENSERERQRCHMSWEDRSMVSSIHWCRNWLSSKSLLLCAHCACNYSNMYLQKSIRMNVDTFDELLHIVGPSISKLSTNFKDSIAPEERLAVTLRFCLLMPRNTKAVTCYKRYKLGTKTFVTGCAKHVTNTSASSQRETVF